MKKSILQAGACLVIISTAAHAQQVAVNIEAEDKSNCAQQNSITISQSLSTQELDADPQRRPQIEALLKRVSLRQKYASGGLSEEEYGRQKSSMNAIIHGPIEVPGDDSPPALSDLSGDPDMQARVNAFQKKLILRGRLEIRAISKEEYDREISSLDEIIHYQGLMTNQVNPEQVMTPDIHAQVDAFKMSVLLQRQYQRGQITAEEYGQQSDTLNEIMQRPVPWMIIE